MDKSLWGLSPAFVSGVILFAVLVSCLCANINSNDKRWMVQ